jgi:hypothetical protein
MCGMARNTTATTEDREGPAYPNPEIIYTRPTMTIAGHFPCCGNLVRFAIDPYRRKPTTYTVRCDRCGRWHKATISPEQQTSTCRRDALTWEDLR